MVSEWRPLATAWLGAWASAGRGGSAGGGAKAGGAKAGGSGSGGAAGSATSSALDEQQPILA